MWLKEPTQSENNSISIVFVHGLFSDGQTCWYHENETYWPELLSCEPELDNIGIYVYGYQTSLTSGSYSLSNVVDDLKERFFNLDNIDRSKKIIFVCHSMGGIIVRKFIVERVNDLLDKNIEIGLFLVASPSLGSNYANLAESVANALGHSQIKALRFSQDNQWLNDLDKTFINLKESKRIKIIGKEIIEDKFIILKSFLRRQVVEPYSGARYFGESFKVSKSDHFSIAKPENNLSDQHRLLLDFIRKNFLNEKIKPSAPDKSELNISKLSNRLGTYLSTAHSPHHDEFHQYISVNRIDLLDYQKGDFYSIRHLHVKNISNNYSSFVSYVECSEKKCSFFDTKVRALNTENKKPLKVECLTDERDRNFSHAFKIFFPSPLKPGEEFKLTYAITLPGELNELSDKNEIMSIFLGRIKNKINELKFSVCLNFEPSSINAECEDIDSSGNYYEVIYDGEPIRTNTMDSVCLQHIFCDELGINWENQNPTCLSILVNHPKHKLYKIRYMR